MCISTTIFEGRINQLTGHDVSQNIRWEQSKQTCTSSMQMRCQCHMFVFYIIVAFSCSTFQHLEVWMQCGHIIGYNTESWSLWSFFVVFTPSYKVWNETKALRLKCCNLMVFTSSSSCYIIPNFKWQTTGSQHHLTESHYIHISYRIFGFRYFTVNDWVEQRRGNFPGEALSSLYRSQLHICLLWGCFAFSVVDFKRNIVGLRSGHWLGHSERFH